MADIRVNDIFEELVEENLKITECLNVLIRFKSFVDMISDKLKTILESKALETLKDLQKEVEDIFRRNKIDFSVQINKSQTKLQLIESLSSKPQTTHQKSRYLSSDQSIRNSLKVKSNVLKQRLLSKKKAMNWGQMKTTEDNDNLINKNQSFICDFIGCGKSLTSHRGLKAHQKTHSTDPKRFKCHFEGCHYSTDKRIVITDHINSHKGIKPFICSYCERRFTSQRQMIRHIKIIHEIADQILICGLEDCHKEFSTELSLRRHQETLHLKEKRFVCEEPNCSFKSVFESNLKLHFKRIHIGERPFSCHFEGCSKTYKSISELNEHIERHTTERRFKCSVEGCDKTFKLSRDLKMHSILHSDIQLRCDWPGCEYTTVKVGRLRSHQTSHSTDCKFVCEWPQCGKQFKKKAYLENHQRIHKNDKKYVCSWPGCQYRCTDSGNFIKHKRVHIKR